MAAHRYWRLFISEVQSSGYVSCMELRLLDAGSNNVATGGTASASSVGFGWVAANAFNGSTTGDGWHSGTNDLPPQGVTPEWLKYDLGAGNDEDVRAFTFVSRPLFHTTQAPKNMTLQYSDDNSVWNDLIVVLNETAWSPSGEERTYNAPAEASDVQPQIMVIN